MEQEQHQKNPSSQEKPSPDTTLNTDATQIIAHRGFKRKYPENSLSAFKGAVEAGSSAVELDLALSQDGVVVISHDASLKRCFGVNKQVAKCDYDYLKTVTMIQEPHEPVPRLDELLQYLAQPEAEHVWAFLDVKLTNDPVAIIPRIAETIASVPPAQDKPWHTRLILGCWSSAFLPPCIAHLPSFPLSLVCFDLHAARRFFPLPNIIAYNVNQKVLMGPLGRGFVEDAHKAGKMVFVWTPNDENAMRWCVRNRVDGVVTDDPELCRQLVGTPDPAGSDKITFGQKTEILGISLLVALFGWIFRLKFLPKVKLEASPKAKPPFVH